MTTTGSGIIRIGMIKIWIHMIYGKNGTVTSQNALLRRPRGRFFNWRKINRSTFQKTGKMVSSL
jgi:hypothetical protein